jgi:hypothetical protein
MTKRMAEELADYLLEMGVKTHYLHSEVDTLERVEILRDLRLGIYDVVVNSCCAKALICPRSAWWLFWMPTRKDSEIKGLFDSDYGTRSAPYRRPCDNVCRYHHPFYA